MKEEVCRIEGSWLKNVIIDGELLWDVEWEECTPYRMIPDKEMVLPSDWRYREDLIWLMRNDMDRADAWKVR